MMITHCSQRGSPQHSYQFGQSRGAFSSKIPVLVDMGRCWGEVSSSSGPWGDDQRREGIVFVLWTYPCPGCLGWERLWQGGSGYWDTQVIVKPGEGKQRTAFIYLFFDKGII